MDAPDSDRREDFYRRCQQIVDELHQRIAAGEYITEEQCKAHFGKDAYNAFLHQLRLHNADIDYSVMTPALEWMHHSRYFQWKIDEERRQRRNSWATYLTAGAAIVSAIGACITICFTQCSSERPNQYYIDSSYSETYQNERENDPKSLIQPVPEVGINIKEKMDESNRKPHKPE